jgi:Fe-S cluster assembly scaffold protein SufB
MTPTSSETEVRNVKMQIEIYRQLKRSLVAEDLASYEKVDVYKQMGKQLQANMRRYYKEGKEDLARIISQSLAA